MPGGYDLDATAPGTLAVQADYARRSKEVGKAANASLDLSYGPHARQSLDIFPAGRSSPGLVFFHGGFWRAGSKNARRFPAPEWNRIGVAWIPVNYRLLPQHRLEDAVSDARSALAWLEGNAADHGVDPGRLHLTGNSAGAQLAAMAAAEDCDGSWRRTGVASLSVISGLFDLMPLIDTPANGWLGLTADSAAALSPVHSLPPGDLPVAVGWGGAETDAFAMQSRAYARACRSRGIDAMSFVSPGKDHFQIIGEYGEPGSPLFGAIRRLIQG